MNRSGGLGSCTSRSAGARVNGGGRYDAAALPPMTLAPGFRLGPYEITAPLGAGGMGEVYRARDTSLDRDVAVKVLPERVATSAEALARFEREAKAVAALSHPNILAIHDFGGRTARAYAVTELLEGETLRERLVGRRDARSARPSSTRPDRERARRPRTPRESSTATSSPRTCS